MAANNTTTPSLSTAPPTKPLDIAASTVLDRSIPAGANVIPMKEDAALLGFQIGQTVIIGEGTDLREERTIVGFGSLILDRPLEYAHARGTLITAVVGNPWGDASLVLAVQADDVSLRNPYSFKNSTKQRVVF